MLTRNEHISQIIVTAAQMRDIEAQIFAAGMPVPALMEKVAGLITKHIQNIVQNNMFPSSSSSSPTPSSPQAGILVGPGHNGGDALVVARWTSIHRSERQHRALIPLSRS